MEPLDNFIFQKVEDLRATKEFQKVLDAYSNLDEKPQEVVKALMAASLVLIPFLVITIFFSMNSSLQGEIDDKKELLELSQGIIREKSTVSSAQRQFVGPTPVSSQGDMQNLISSAISLAGIDASKVSVSNFQPGGQAGMVSQSMIDMKFQDLTNDQLFSFLTNLSQRSKVLFDEISVKKNTESKLLEGIATLVYLSKENENTNPDF